MEVRQVDFRDAAEDEFSSVPGLLLVEARPRPGGSPVEKLGFHATEYEISDARSVYEVLAWAEAHSGPERTYCVCVVSPGNLDPDTKWMDRLAGVDPTNHST